MCPEVSDTAPDLAAFGDHAEPIACWLKSPAYSGQRRRALFTLPMLAPALASATENPTWLAIGAGVDRGDPLHGLVATSVGVKLDTVHSLTGKGPDLIGNGWFSRPMELLWALDLVPVARVPISPSDWSDFRSYWLDSSLGSCDAYREPAWVSRRRKFLLEHLFAGLCEAGYGADTEHVRQELQLCSTCQYGIADYAYFVEEDWLQGRGSDVWGERPSFTETILMRYPASELVRQLRSWQGQLGSQNHRGDERSSLYPTVAHPDIVMRRVLPDYRDVMYLVKRE